jgi:5-methylcytosine-specific restriction protein A
MPYTSLRPCTYPGCNNLVAGGRCPKHAITRSPNRSEKERRRLAARELPGSPWQFYRSAEWRRLKRDQLEREPFCRHCRDAGAMTKATDVDHITPIADGGSKLSRFNLQSLCKLHHNRKTAQERTARARQQRRHEELLRVHRGGKRDF